jgi:hypothetical protein
VTFGLQQGSRTQAWSYDSSVVSSSDGLYNGPSTGSISVSLTGVDFGFNVYSATLRFGRTLNFVSRISGGTACEVSAWRSNSALTNKISTGSGGFSLVNGFGDSVLLMVSLHSVQYNMSLVFSYDRVSVRPFKVPSFASSGAILISESICRGLGLASFSQSARMGLSSFEYSGWKSDSSVICKFSRGAAGGVMQMIVTTGLQFSILTNPGAKTTLQGPASIGSCSKLTVHVHVPPPASYSTINDIVSIGRWKIASIPSMLSPDIASKLTLALQHRLNQVTYSGFDFLANSWSGLGIKGWCVRN